MPKANSQDKILENGKETDIVIPLVITSCSIWILTKTYHSIMGATGAGKSSVSDYFTFPFDFKSYFGEETVHKLPPRSRQDDSWS